MTAEIDVFDENQILNGGEISEDSDTSEILMAALTGLNENCIDKILNYLNVGDLLNVADSSKWLKKNAQLAFKRLKKKKIVINKWIKPNDIFRILRNFGHLTLSLQIEYHEILPNLHGHMNVYIAEYCSVSSTELLICHADKNAMNGLNKSFPNVEKVYILEGDTLDKLLHFHQWFPKMTDLGLIVTGRQFESNTKYVEKAIPMNPQLKRLCIRGCVNMNILKSISNLRFLETLNLGELLLQNFDQEEEIIQFQTVKSLDLYGCWTSLLFLRLVQLDELYLSSVSFSDAIDFIMNHPTITKLRIKSIEASEESILKLHSALPSLKKLALVYIISIELAFLITKIVDSLDEFDFVLGPYKIDRNRLLAYFDDKWEIIVYHHHLGVINLKRKIKSN